jgi:acyl-coenzyme A synthetase/AMP-(fatty) acid ligase
MQTELAHLALKIGVELEAYVVLEDPQAKLTARAKYKVPKKVVFVQELPKTLMGKALRRKLRAYI